MPEENQTRLVYLNSCSSSFCVLTLTLSQNPRFCSHFLLEREINDKRGGCLDTAPLVYKYRTKSCFLEQGRNQQAGDSFSEGGLTWPATSAQPSKTPGDFPNTIFTVLIHAITYTWLHLLPLGYTVPPGQLAWRHCPGSERCTMKSLSKPLLLGAALN